MPYKDKEKKKEYNKKYRQKNRERLDVNHKEYYKEHEEELKAYSKQYNIEHSEEKKAYRKQYCETHKEEITIRNKQYNITHKEEKKIYYKTYNDEHREKRLGQHLEKQYGISLEDYQILFEKQNGVCAICEKQEFTRRLAIDHDHITGKIRSLLCGNCNSALGNFDDDPEILARAIQYLNGDIKKEYSNTHHKIKKATRKERKREGNLIKNYGITLTDYQHIYEAQWGLCAICLKPESVAGHVLSVDHCHQNNIIRGLLCGSCNFAIGGFKDDPAILAKAIEYLKSHKSH